MKRRWRETDGDLNQREKEAWPPAPVLRKGGTLFYGSAGRFEIKKNSGGPSDQVTLDFLPDIGR